MRSRDHIDAEGNFSTGFDQKSGEMMVYGGLTAAAILGLFTILNGNIVAAVATLAAIALAYYHWPMVQPDLTQLRISPRGIDLHGLGTLPWEAIGQVDITTHAVRAIPNENLRINLRVPVSDLLPVSAKGPNLKSRLTYKCWKIALPDLVLVKLEPLSANSDAVMNAISTFRR